MNIYPDKDLLESSLISKYDNNKKLLFSKKDLIGSLAKWSIRQSPKNIPDDLIIVLDKFADHIDMYFEKLDKNELGFMEMILPELSKFLMGNLITIKEFSNWNLSQAEKKMNIKIEDDRGDHCITMITRFSEDDTYYDFVDLDALIRNISHDVYDSNT